MSSVISPEDRPFTPASPERVFLCHQRPTLNSVRLHRSRSLRRPLLKSLTPSRVRPALISVLPLTHIPSLPMDPDRHLPIPGRKRPRNPPPIMPPSTSDPHPRPIPPSTSTYQPSLPSIRQLHPYLPPSGAAHPHLPAQDYGYAHTTAYAGPSGSTDPQPMLPQGAMYPRSEGLDSEPEGEAEQPGPAKKKRRRQALSCNGTSFGRHANPF